MTISAQIIADSISPEGVRLTTFQLRYPRFIHAEELTHRILETQPELIITEVIPDGLMYDQDLSRNASSSRAIPVNRMIADLRRDPVMPMHWGSNKPGMQAGEELTGVALQLAQSAWLGAMEDAIKWAEAMIDAGLHKQIANRILEPWAHINVVVTATQWENFFTLRRHKDAQPEIKELADQMFNLMEHFEPKRLQPGEWHLPYVTINEFMDIQEEATAGTDATSNPHTTDALYAQGLERLKKVSVARCARVSYLTFEGKQTTLEEDLALFDKLVVSQPLHASPAEHQATPDTHEFRDAMMAKHAGKGENAWEPNWENPHLHGNLVGWIQYRKTLDGEFVPG